MIKIHEFSISPFLNLEELHSMVKKVFSSIKNAITNLFKNQIFSALVIAILALMLGFAVGDIIGSILLDMQPAPPLNLVPTTLTPVVVSTPEITVIEQ